VAQFVAQQDVAGVVEGGVGAAHEVEGGRGEATRNRGAWVDPVAGRDRVGEWAERWFSSTVALRPGTRRTYRLLLDH
jgi:hypothetical protein